MSGMNQAPTARDVRTYWNSNPLFSHELENVGSREFFEAIDALKVGDIEAFNLDWWGFDRFAGKRLVDIGCGHGWYSVRYRAGGADVTSVDLTSTATRLVRDHARLHQLTSKPVVANVEELPFPDDTFDVLVASGVLHHTPDTPRALSECHRILAPGGRAKITLYCRGLLHSPLLFPLVRLAANRLGASHPAMREIKTVEDFVRQYDGVDNPVGIADTRLGWIRACERAGFRCQDTRLGYFPRRFMPAPTLIPRWGHRLLTQHLGTMVYLDLVKTP